MRTASPFNLHTVPLVSRSGVGDHKGARRRAHAATAELLLRRVPRRLNGETLPAPSRGVWFTEHVDESVTVLLAGLSQANAVLALEDTVTWAGAAKVVADVAGSAWLDSLRTASDAGEFSASLSGFMLKSLSLQLRSESLR